MSAADTPARAVLRALRPHQWSKNALVALPLLLAHRATDGNALATVGLAIVAFSLCASGTYIINDLRDLEHDRAHPTKRMRPFASGALSPGVGLGLAAGLLSAAFALALAALSLEFTALLGVYTLLTLAYSLRLRAIPVLDVMVLAALYALRVLAGGAAVRVPVSEWLLAFSLFFFLGLALLKRYAELRPMEVGAMISDTGRGYVATDATLLRAMGPACGLLAVLVLALYVTGPDVQVLYASPELLWLASPPLIYWVLRMWLLAHRGEMLDDPVLFAVRDRVSYLVVGLVILVMVAATITP